MTTTIAETTPFTKDLALRCQVIEISREQARSAIVGKHYLGRFPAVNPLILALFCDCWIKGVSIFSIPPRETSKRYGEYTWEFSRLWVSDEMPRNTESWFVAKSIKIIRERFPHVKRIVTYADPSVGHTGTLYKACNFVYDGMTEERKTPRFDYYRHGAKVGRSTHGFDEKKPRVSKKRFCYRLYKTRCKAVSL